MLLLGRSNAVVKFFLFDYKFEKLKNSIVDLRMSEYSGLAGLERWKVAG